MALLQHLIIIASLCLPFLFTPLYCFAIFNLVFLLSYSTQRKRVKCPARLCSPPTAKDQSKTTPSSNAPDTPSTRPGKSADPVAKPSTVPLTPIEIPKENPVEDERLKQLESPETAELIKTFEITDPVVEKPSEPEVVSPPKPVATPSPPTPPVVVQKEEPVAPPVAEPPKKAPVTDPTESLFSPPPTQNTNPAKDLKEATTDFLAQEFNQPKKQSKRYAKSRQKKNHTGQ